MITLRSYWAKYSNNFGDILTPYLLAKMGYPVRWVGRGSPDKLLAVGSILEWLKPNDVVWGSGTIKDLHLRVPAGARILAVRGPLTRAALVGDVPDVYGDPGLLLPRFYTPTFTHEFDVGVIPHDVEKDVPPVLDSKILWIDINAGVEAVVNQIARCDVILSSSLHGIIAAEAYGIPAGWIRMTGRIHGGDFKYNDYTLSTCRDVSRPLRWDPDLLTNLAQRTLPTPSFNTEDLLRVFREHFGEGRK